MKTINVGIADMKLTNDPEAELVTYGLGSCIGITLYDPVAKVGGILHFMLPFYQMDPRKAAINPWIFADTGIPEFLRRAYRYGAEKGRLLLKAAGGAQMLDENGFFRIGKNNIEMMHKIMKQENLIIQAEDIGGFLCRSLYLEVGTGKVWVKSPGSKEVEL